MSVQSQPSFEVTGRSLIAGGESSGRGEQFHPWHPAAGTRSNTAFVAATPDDVHAAAQAASAAFSVLGRCSVSQIAACLEGAAEELLSLGDVLVDAASEETGLAKARITVERDRTVKQLRMFGGIAREGGWVEAVIDRGDASRQPQAKPDIRRMLRPLGPVVVFGASNFPLAYSVAGGDTASALAAGCPVIVKGHSAHPATGELVARALCRAVIGAGLPPGTFSFLHAGGARDIGVGLELMRHPLVAAGGFTGSVGAGMALARVAAERPRPVPFFAEMGSVNPVVVLPRALDADPEGLAAKLHASFTNSVGQMCTCPGLIFVRSGPACERFVSKLVALAESTAPQPMLTARVREAWERGVRDSIASGAARATSGGGAVVLRIEGARFHESARTHEECFGPSTVVVECATVDEMLRGAALVGGSLTATLWIAEPDAEAASAMAALESLAGRVVVNGVPTGVEVCDAMVHSGPFPASNRPDSTAVGAFAIRRWCRPVAFQSTPDSLLPAALQDANPLKIPRLENGRWGGA